MPVSEIKSARRRAVISLMRSLRVHEKDKGVSLIYRPSQLPSILFLRRPFTESTLSLSHTHCMKYILLCHHITSYHIISHHITSCHITSYHIISYRIISHHIMSHHITSCHITSYHITSCHITSHYIMSHHIT